MVLGSVVVKNILDWGGGVGGGGVKAQEVWDECEFSRAATIHRFIDIS